MDPAPAELHESRVSEADRADIPVASGKLSVGENVQLYYELHGNGADKVLLVMGLGTSARAWEPTAAWLVRQSPSLQVCIYDNRGVGRSSVPEGRYTTSMMAQDALKLVDQFEGWDRFHVVGISMGGMISQEIALAAPSRVKTLHLGVTHSGGPGSFPPLAGLFGVIKSGTGNKTPEERAPIVLRMMYPDHYLQAAHESGKTNMEVLSQHYIETVKSLPAPNPKGHRSQVMAVNTHSVGKERLHKLRNSKIPILICTGTVDDLVNPKASFFLKEQLNPAEFIVWKGAGHGIIVQMFDEYHQSLLRHFARAQEPEAH